MLGLLLGLMAACGGSGDLSERLLDIDASETICTQRSDATQNAVGSGTKFPVLNGKLIVRPGERVRLRVYSYSDKLMEIIVTDEAGVALRREKLQPGIRNIDPSENAAAVLPGEQAAGELAHLPGEQAAGELSHEGHDDEIGPDATEDYTYRMLIDPGETYGVRNMVITFPDGSEDYVLNRLICADPNSLEQVVVAEIARR